MTSHPARDDDVPIVLLHGATSSARIWQPLLPNLTSRHRVVVPTLAGHRGGPSIPNGGGTTLERIVDDMCRQLDEAGIPRRIWSVTRWGVGSPWNSPVADEPTRSWRCHLPAAGLARWTYNGCC